MKLRRILGWSAVGLAGYMTYKVVEVSTRPLPPEPIHGIDLRGYGKPVDGAGPEDADRFMERFSSAARRNLDPDSPAGLYMRRTGRGE